MKQLKTPSLCLYSTPCKREDHIGFGVGVGCSILVLAFGDASITIDNGIVPRFLF
ncbi:MAG: hypothetical protein PUI12_07325 [Bacteroidales bacterium]|nr:hypothetical protein [Bacteroidales bacterium]